MFGSYVVLILVLIVLAYFFIKLFQRLHQQLAPRFTENELALFLLLSIICAHGGSLVRGVWKPLQYGVLFPSMPERIHRGWPFPWWGLAGFEQTFAMPFFLINTIVWYLFSYFILITVVRRIPKASYTPSGTIQRRILAACVVAIFVIAYVLPFLLPFAIL